MKVGDLVMLSAYGKQLGSNKPIGPEELGIIVGLLATGFTIRWFEYSNRSPPRGYRKVHDPIHFRNELRFAKCK